MGREGGIAAAKKYAATPEQRAWSSRGGKNPSSREAKSAAGKKRFELYGNPATPEGCSKGGKNVSLEARQRGGRNGPREAKVLGGEIATHIRWHVSRGPKNPKKCRLCAEEMMRRKTITTLEHKIGTLKIVSAGITQFSNQRFLRVELPLAGKKHPFFKVFLVDDEGWTSDPKDVLKSWEMFNTETVCNTAANIGAEL